MARSIEGRDEADEMNAHWFSRLSRPVRAGASEHGAPPLAANAAAIDDFGVIDGDRALAAVLAFGVVRKVRESEAGTVGLALG